MKYISMKMEPKGSRPPIRAITLGCRYHFFAGMGEGMRFTRQGLSGWPAQLRPTTWRARTPPREPLCSGQTLSVDGGGSQEHAPSLCSLRLRVEYSIGN